MVPPTVPTEPHLYSKADTERPESPRQLMPLSTFRTPESHLIYNWVEGSKRYILKN